MPTILLSNNTIKGYAGSELVTLDLATEFKHRGYDVTIATFGKDTDVVKGLDELDVKWLDLNIQQPNVENIVFDLIWAHHFTTLDAILMDMEISAKAIIFSSMSPYEPLESPPTYASQLSLVLANSEETRNQLLHYGLPLSMLHVFPNPVAREWFAIAKTASNLPLRKVAVVSNHVVDELQGAIKHLQTLGVLVEIFGVEYDFKLVTPTLLASFDCVLTIGRTVQQAMVLGLPVYCYDRFGGPGYLRTDNFEKAGLFNYSGRCCGVFKTAEEIATELVDGYQSAVISASELQLIAHEKYRLDFAVSQVLELIADNTLDLSIVSTALKLPLRMRKHAKNLEPNQLFAQLFLDNGSGFLESTSIRIPLSGIQASQSSRDLVFDLPDNHSLVNIRLDPLNACAVITIHRVELLGPEGCVDLTDCIKTNAKASTNNTHFFIDDDPQIFFEDTTFIRATHLKFSLAYQATGSEALKEFITQHEARFPSSTNIADSEQSYNQISQRLIEQQAKSFTPIKEELIARIHEIASLNQQASKRDEEISNINQANTEREQVHLTQLSQARQQIEDQLLQLVEREKASSEQLQQMQLAHEQQKSEQSHKHAEREQAHLAQLGQARQQIEAQLLQLVKREEAFSEKLQYMQLVQEQQVNEQRRELAEHEQAHQVQLDQARQQIENKLHQLAVREKEFTEQLFKIQYAHDQQRIEQSREHAEREKTLLSELKIARQQIDVYLLDLAKCEKTYSQQLQESQQRHEQQKLELIYKHAEQEKSYLAQLALARQKLKAHLLKLADREKKFSQQLQAIRQTSDQRKREHTGNLAERDKTFSRQLQEIQQAHEHQKSEQSREHAARELVHLAQLDQAREQIEAHLLELAEREKAFSTQLQAMHLAHEQQKNAQSQQHAEREQAHIAQLTLARQQIEAHLLQLAEREKVFSEQLQKIQQTYEHQTSTQSQQHAEREQALNEQLTARKDELRNQLNHWAETEKAHALAVNELHRELNAIRSTFSWRWTAPLRSLAAALRQQNSEKPQMAPAPVANEVLTPGYRPSDSCD
ncbi:hypothetical protein [Polaromonas sp. DSR2-3-2]|uniref:hypothetical protein n=1 Tax=unclassified Polaromonas TaxID=2638319 RepID=UPI003CEA1565